MHNGLILSAWLRTHPGNSARPIRVYKSPSWTPPTPRGSLECIPARMNDGALRTSLVPCSNRAAVKARISAAGFRTSGDVLDDLDARVEALIRQAIRGMGGLGRKTISVEALNRGRLRA